MSDPVHLAGQGAPHADPDGAGQTTAGKVARWLRRTATVLVFVAVVDYLVLPRIAGTERSLHLLSTVDWPWVAGGIALEALSLVSYSLLTRAVLAEPRVSFSWILRTDLAGLGVGHVLPGGAPTANALRYRLLRQGGADAEDVGISLAMQSVGATLTLLALLWVALLAAIPVYGPSPTSVAATLVGAAVAVGVVLAVRGRSGLRAHLSVTARAVIRRLPLGLRSRVVDAAREAAAHAAVLLSNRRALRGCAMWAGGNWLLDAASLWLFLAAYGYRMSLVGLLVAYGIANTLALVPVSPGGLGVVEGALIPSLLGFGAPSSVAVLAVLSWRLVEFWAPIPIAGLAYVTLRAQAWLRPLAPR